MSANMEKSAMATGLEKISFHSNPKETNVKECSNYHTTVLISHASKVMLKILQARLQQYVNRELPGVYLLEKEMATHSSVLAWRIPGTGEPGGLLSMGLHRVGHDWRDLAAAAAVDLVQL